MRASGFTGPALYLASLFTNLLACTRHISIKAWHEQVALWLAEDLPGFQCMWIDVTDLMSTKGHYFLYGDAVNPLSFATIGRLG